MPLKVRVMKKMKYLLSALGLTLLSACGGGGNSCSTPWLGLAGGSCSAPATSVAPAANAGLNQFVKTGDTVTLDGSKSTVQAGQTATYRWAFNSIPAGSAAKLQIDNVLRPTFLADKTGTYVITLTVNDGKVDSVPAIITVTASVTNVKPTANAGITQNVITGSTVMLDGSATNDPNRDLLTYSWQMASRPAGSTATLNKSSEVKPTFVADKNGAYVISLQAYDGTEFSELAYVTINAATANSAPVAVAGANQFVVQGTTVTLDGTASSDVNRDLLTYSWTIAATPLGSAARLSSSTSAKPNFTPDLIGSYVLGLRVNDGTIDSDVSFVSITVSNINLAPVASAGASQNVNTGNTVTLDASASTDANNDRLSYSWAFVSRPPQSSARLSDTTSAKPTFLADQSGDYVLGLSVSDGKSTSPFAYTTVTASNTNLAPTAKPGLPQNVLKGATVTLDGSTSSDPNRDLLNYSWSVVAKPSGSLANLSGANTPTPSFIADQSGLYIFGLSVTDGKLSSPVDYVSVNASVANVAPVALAMTTQPVVLTDTRVSLDGSGSSDANNDTLSYTWTLVSRPANSLATLNLQNPAMPTFLADQPGTYVFSLITSDGKLSSNTSIVTVLAGSGNLAPTANGGNGNNTNISVALGSTANLDGSLSIDPNGDKLSYSWAMVFKPATSTSVLLGNSGPKTAFVPDLAGVYVVSLIVNDGRTNSDPVYLTVTVR